MRDRHHNNMGEVILINFFKVETKKNANNCFIKLVKKVFCCYCKNVFKIKIIKNVNIFIIKIICSIIYKRMSMNVITFSVVILVLIFFFFCNLQ